LYRFYDALGALDAVGMEVIAMGVRVGIFAACAALLGAAKAGAQVVVEQRRSKLGGSSTTRVGLTRVLKT
jgi:hypothetical protein